MRLSRLSPLLVLGASLGATVWACGGGRPSSTPEPAPPPAPAPPDTVGPVALPGERPAPELPPGVGPPDTVVSHLDVRVGLSVGAGNTSIGGGDALVVSDPSGTELSRQPEGVAWRVRPTPTAAGGLVELDQGTTTRREDMLVFRPAVPGRFVRVGTKDYRGEVWVFRDRTGLTIVNRLGIESYLAGVVPLEIGRRRPDEVEAVKAQAIVSRTFAVKNLGRWRRDGFDFYPTVADQVYGGVTAETPLVWEAVRATRGVVITFRRAPIDAFFFSTCGGRTANGTEIFRNADRTYLQSIDDRDGDGEAYCRASPRFRWRERWSGEQLRGILQRTLPAQSGVETQGLGTLRDIRVGRRTGSGRVAVLDVTFDRRTVEVDGPAVRRVLLSPSGQLLRSNAFMLEAERDGDRLVRLEAQGQGAGHGVGMCQWGIIGRARDGQRYPEMLAAYFPGTTLEPMR